MKGVLFDLDGTLHEMNQEKFSKAYYKSLINAYAKFGYDGDLMASALSLGVLAMKDNDGTVFNEDRFWTVFKEIFGEKALKDKDSFIDYYKSEDYSALSKHCAFKADAPVIIKKLKELGFKVILASNPIFHEEGFVARLAWAGLKKEDFDYVTTFSNSSFCKPSSGYYEEILKNTGLKAEECVMVGNDTQHDMAAKNAGIDVFLITGESLISHGEDVNAYPNGDLKDALNYILNKNGFN